MIEIKQMSKKFKNYRDKSNTLKERLLKIRKNDSKEHWVLQNINLTISKGECVALIGRNGSGKSTLLKLMTKILYPNKGEVIVKGRVSSLLELGAGFHPDFTGRENIYMNASVLGLLKREIDERMEAIIKFSELKEYIDQPVRIYSSGMYMRLAFSIAISIQPDVMLIDEVLAVGDAAFQNKCINKIEELKTKGTTIVIVAHNGGIIEKLCDRAIWLSDGEIMDDGNPRMVNMKYMQALSERENARLLEEEAELAQLEKNNRIEYPSTKASELSPRVGNRKVEITAVKLMDDRKVCRKDFRTGTSMSILIEYKVNEAFEEVSFGIGFFTSENICCYATNTKIDRFTIKELGSRGVISCEFSELSLLPGTYMLDVAVLHPNKNEPYDYLSKQFNFQVSSDVKDEGIARLKHHWAVEVIS
ncbi:ABC transporter ATP-binding protein [Cohnella abietis]|uniref:ABC transporter ATP-binding protein n=1 Tax=Cohnella abietis TaxID=2507935 RepID=UPI001E5D1928|nr:ABC transporter ATP-binding protein [Cohnella abietis]